MDCLNSQERKALENAALGIEWEHRSKLGGDKTFDRLLKRGWIEPFSGYNPNGDKYSITEAGRQARKLPPCSGRKRDSRIQEPKARLPEMKGRLDK